MADNQSFRKESLLPLTLPVATLLAGFILLQKGWLDYGITFFCLFPFLVGMAWRLAESDPETASSAKNALAIFCVILLIFTMEGIFCILLASPLIALLGWLGLRVGSAIRRKNGGNEPPVGLSIFVWPLVLLFVGNEIETRFFEREKSVVCTSSVELPHSPERVFDFIKEAGAMKAELGPLQKMGLPVPIRCDLTGDFVGAERTCQLSDGITILAQITEFERGKSLKMTVFDWKMPGKSWLGFTDAGYEFEKTADGQGCKLTRYSTYTTRLRPRIYWEFLEKMAVEEEHEFVLNDLRRRLDE